MVKSKLETPNSSEKIVCVMGQGFVGSVMSLVIANSEKCNYFVYGLELANEQGRHKVESLNSGKFPFDTTDKNVKELYQNALVNKKYLATTDKKVLGLAEIIVVDINLDVRKSSSEYNIVIEPFVKAIETIGRYCKSDVLIMVETTVPPGTCDNIVVPTLKKCLSKRKLKMDKVKVVHSYERVMPGENYIDSIINMPRVFSGINLDSTNAGDIFLSSILNVKDYPLVELQNTNSSELAKVLENSYRAMNIAFMVEWSRLAETAGINLFEVISAIRQRPTHKNIMAPGLGVGGYCLTKDPLLADWSAKEVFGIEGGLEFSRNAVKKNDEMPKAAFDWVYGIIGNKISDTQQVILGTAYKGDVGDTRYSPVAEFYSQLLGYNTNIILFDPMVNFWQETNTEVLCSYADLQIMDGSAVYICTSHSMFKSEMFLGMLASLRECHFFDFNGLYSKQEIDELSKNNKVHVLGVGS